jgi:hypothetical protein
MSRSHELAWAAGFFDGEGWIKIQSRGSEKYQGYYLRLGINHVKRDPLDKIQKLFGGNIRVDTKVSGNRKPRHVWTLSTKSASEALEQMMPYLANKNQVAQLGLDFQQTVGLTGQRVSKEVQQQRSLIADKIKYLNSLD